LPVSQSAYLQTVLLILKPSRMPYPRACLYEMHPLQRSVMPQSKGEVSLQWWRFIKLIRGISARQTSPLHNRRDTYWNRRGDSISHGHLHLTRSKSHPRDLRYYPSYIFANEDGALDLPETNSERVKYWRSYLPACDRACKQHQFTRCKARIDLNLLAWGSRCKKRILPILRSIVNSLVPMGRMMP
jgi:hypothetical protein